MTTQLDLAGLWVPVVTPFDHTGDVDAGSLGRLAARLLADGARGLVALGTTGEPATLDAGERAAVVRACGDACRRAGAPLIVGAGTNSTRGTVEEIERVCAAGPVDAVLVVVPYYTRPSAAGVIEHYLAVAGASPVPVVAYDVPARTGVELDAAVWREVGAHPNVIGLKQAVGGLDQATLELLRSLPPGFQVLAGDDAFIAPTILMGGVGAISAAAHLRTADFAAMIRAARAGQVPRARHLAEGLLPLVAAGFAEPNPAVWKAALHHRGDIATPDVRRPLTAASPEATAALLATLP